jgi:hypothetical protein
LIKNTPWKMGFRREDDIKIDLQEIGGKRGGLD